MPLALGSKRERRLAARHPGRRLAESAARLDTLQRGLGRAATRRLQGARERLAQLSRTLHAVSPLATLDRGYAIVEDLETGKVLVDADDATVGSDIRARLANGELTATIKSKTS